MHIYHSALEDLLGHVAIECRERALMLSLLWDHFSSLVVVYMRLLLQERKEAVEVDVSGMEQEIENLKHDLRAKDAEKKVFRNEIRRPLFTSTAPFGLWMFPEEAEPL